MNRILIVGSGDIAMRTLRLLARRFRVFALLRNPARAAAWRAAGAIPVIGDLDERRSLRRLAGLADIVLHCAPPAATGERDLRTTHLLAALGRAGPPRHLIYLSTTGVYGPCQDAWVTETRPPRPLSPRARRRLDAEQKLRSWAARQEVRLEILRVPGIYAADRLPLERIRAGIPVLLPAEDGYSNHVHADDLAAMLLAALRRGRPNRIYHACDDSQLKMGEYLDLVADTQGLPRPPRCTRAEAMRLVPPEIWSFMSESRRITNRRLKQELGYRLRFPSVSTALCGKEMSNGQEHPKPGGQRPTALPPA